MPRAECGFAGDAETPGSQYLVEHGPTIFVDVGFDSDYDPSSSDAPNAQRKGIPALIDTGADVSSIDSALAAELGLPIHDKISIAGVSGMAEMYVYLAQIYVPLLGITEFGVFCGAHLTAGGQPHQVLIGRTFLQRNVMIYDGQTGHVTLLA